MNQAVDGFFDEAGNFALECQLPPAIYNPIEALLGEYDLLKSQLAFISANAKKDQLALSHFLHGNKHSGVHSFNVDSIFNLEGALRSLNSSYWSKAMKLTDAMDVFSATKRNEWSNMIHEMKTPDFERDSVITTLMDLVNNRGQFFAEKVDGVYRNLSRNHKTNDVFGFSERMIIDYCITSYGSLNHDQMNYVSDLRSCISTLNGNDIINSWSTYYDVNRLMDAKRFGEWVEFDGAAFRLRIYKKGTVHIEIHPDISWKLNKVLAMLHPAAIPSELREPPKKKFKEFVLRDDVIDIKARSAISECALRSNAKYETGNIISKSYFNEHKNDKALMDSVEAVFKYLGAWDIGHAWQFSFSVLDVLREIVRSGVMPNSVEYQFYATPEALAQTVNDLAEIEDNHSVLEPSAGLGSLLLNVNAEQITCVDVSALHCSVLKEKGFKEVICGDFLELDSMGKFDRVIMNPPFSKGRAEAHLIKAFEHLEVGGILVAVLPGSMHNKSILSSADCEFLKIDDAGFEGTKVCVTILKAKKRSH